MTKALILLLSLYSGLAFAVTSTVTGGQSSTDVTYAPSISSGVNTNITSYSSSFRWIYTLRTFQVCQSGAYAATSTTTEVVNTTFFLTGTYAPTTTFPPSTPISSFFISSFSGGFTATFPSSNPRMSLVAGQQYSVLVAYNQTTAGTYPYTNTLTMDGPGRVIFDGNGSCEVSAAPIPTLSEWAKILLSLGLLGVAGWHSRRYLA